MVKLHKQRLTVLLFGWSVMATSGYLGLMGLHLDMSFLVNWDLLHISSVYFPLSVVVDKVSCSFSALVTFIAGCVFFFSRTYMQEDPFYYRFMWILLAFVVSMNLLVFAGAFPVLLLGWDGLGITSFALIIYYQSNSSVRAGFLTLMINRIGDVLLMVCMIFYIMHGMWLVANYAMYTAAGLLGFYSLASMTKSAQYPYSAWLPAAMAAPTPVSALVHSSTLVTAGIYIMIRTFITMSVSLDVGSLFLLSGAVTSLVGGVCALYENDLKKVIAFSTLSQLGVMVFCLGLGNPYLSLLHLYTHAMFKAMLFLVAGYILMLSYGVQDLRLLGRVTGSAPILLVFLNTSTLCLIGAPFLSAYYSKHAILSLMLVSSLNLFALLMMLVATVFTSIYMVRMLMVLNWGLAGTPLTPQRENAVGFYSPCLLLYVGSVLLGWGLSLGDVSYVATYVLPSFQEMMIHSLLFIGILCGLGAYKVGGSNWVQSMFFMDPVSYGVNRVYTLVHHSVRAVEYGWAEPHVYLSWGNRLVMWCGVCMAWPRHGFGFGPVLGVLTSMFGLWYYLKY